MLRQLSATKRDLITVAVEIDRELRDPKEEEEEEVERKPPSPLFTPGRFPWHNDADIESSLGDTPTSETSLLTTL